MKTVYYPPLDTLAIVITALVVVVCVALIGYGISRSGTASGWICLSIGILTLIIPVLFFPYKETLHPDERAIRLHFIGYSRTLTAEDYPRLEVGKAYMGDDAVRLAASGGFFGYWGRWQAGDGTRFTSYITHRHKEVYYLSSKSGKLVALNAPREWIDLLYQR